MQAVRFSLVVLCASDNRGLAEFGSLARGIRGASAYKESPTESMGWRMIRPEPVIPFVFGGADALAPLFEVEMREMAESCFF